MSAVDVLMEKTALGLIRRHGLRSACDHGCGSGELLRQIDRKTGHRLHLTGIDYFSRGKRWRKEWKMPAGGPAGNMTFVDRDSKEFARLSGGKGTFDLVTSVCALHHFRYPCAELQNIRALLRPGGYALVADWDFAGAAPAAVTKNLFSFLSESFHAFDGKYHRHHYTREQALDLVWSTDLNVIRSGTVKISAASADRVDDIQSALCNLAQMKKANAKASSPILKGYFRQEFGVIERLIRQHGVEYPSLYLIIAQKRKR